MKLNPDCIRDILLTVEDTTSPSSVMAYRPSENIYESLLDDEASITPKIEHKRLKPYTDEEIQYHINQCELSGFFTEISWFCGNSCFIQDLSPLGHQFLADIRTDTNWNKTKDIAKKVGSSSLSTLKDISAQVIAEVIKTTF
ncbi:DUF2513 domain-containing protein [Clostridium sp. C2-6-12]|uniref:DUF2513 domain-containing protein n=1 Tax=Clostridium sp. C2-6-12 TaxID=2698832 RepID=UPI00136947C3|nr:DUF2513 domain-containing protein [Clostridium sp. C2-6-12]